jgi:hypothetical protein
MNLKLLQHLQLDMLEKPHIYLRFLVAAQAGLTLLGNTTVAIAALRIALANGWKFEMPQLPGQSKPKEEAAAGTELTTPLSKLSDGDSEVMCVCVCVCMCVRACV